MSSEPDTTLEGLQRYVAEIEKVRGFDQEDVLQKCLLLGEELGELFKAVRSHVGMKMDSNSSRLEVGAELADMLNFILAVANRCEVNLSQAYWQKESINRRRTWGDADL
jgi:NTP pyrophosphatase (non-canonical NTP hydrolase)